MWRCHSDAKQFAQQVKGLVMAMALAAATVATAAGLLVSRTLTSPLQRLHQQTQRWKRGLHSSFKLGQDELAPTRSLTRPDGNQTDTDPGSPWARRLPSELVANVSHDLRTPLSTLRVGLEAVLTDVVEGAKAQQYLKQACRKPTILPTW